MIPLNLSATSLQAYHATLLDSHEIHVTVQILDLDHRRQGDVSAWLLDGQVDYAYGADIDRTASLSFLDPTRALAFDSASPHEGAMYLDRMVRVIYSVRVPGVGWVDVPVFTGPIDAMDRNDDVVSVTGKGKESLAMGACWRPLTLKRGMLWVDAVQTILSERAGEKKFDFPEYTGRLRKDVSLGRNSIPWKAAKRLARSHNCQLFYDGRGVARLRRVSSNAAYIFVEGDGGSITTPVQVSYKSADLVNTVHVIGGIPSGKTKNIDVWVIAEDHLSLSPAGLARTNADGEEVGRYLVKEINDSTLRTTAEAIEVGKEEINAAMLQTVEVRVDSLPIPDLEPGDIGRFETADYSGLARPSSFSLPLTVGSAMSVGYLKRVSQGHSRKPRVSVVSRGGKPAKKVKK